MELYKQIEQCIEDEQPLEQMIASIYDTLLPKRKFRSNGLTQKQCLSLVYQHMRAPLNKLRQKIQTVIKDDYQTNQEQQNNQQQLEDNNQNQQQEQNQEDQQQGYNQDIGQEQDEKNEQDGDNLDDNQNQQNMDDNQMISEEDVGLYGQQIDEEDMESYENQSMGDDPQFGNFKLNQNRQGANKNQEDGQDDYIQDNFDQFRQIELQNNVQKPKEQQTNQLQKQIQNYEQKALKGKNWVLGGQIKARQRPVNSLLDTQLQYKSGVKYSHEINQNYNNNLESIIKQRILDQIYDDRVRYIPNLGIHKSSGLDPVSTEKSAKGLAQLYQIQFKNSLGLGDNKNEKLKKQIMDSFKQINYFLDSLSNTGFALKPTSKFKKNGVEAIVLQDKVPITNWDGTMQAQKTKHNFESQKQTNKKTRRLRNKRNARQRKKQQDRKKTNRSIQYGGITKYEAQARKKIAKTKQTAKTTKFSKSNTFFKNINNKQKAGKPNPNISKLKI